jgi:hypothetical protein
MKRIFSLTAILAIIFASNCSRIPDNNDPVIGIWSNTEPGIAGSVQKVSLRKEWIFNDAYLGRYHKYEGKVLNFKTDFKWEQVDGTYTISYPGTDMPAAKVHMSDATGDVTLQDEKGNILAKRE